jgi:hypothetical protein
LKLQTEECCSKTQENTLFFCTTVPESSPRSEISDFVNSVFESRLARENARPVTELEDLYNRFPQYPGLTPRNKLPEVMKTRKKLFSPLKLQKTLRKVNNGKGAAILSDKQILMQKIEISEINARVNKAVNRAGDRFVKSRFGAYRQEM